MAASASEIVDGMGVEQWLADCQCAQSFAVSRGTVEWSVACAWHERATTPLRGQEGTEAALIVPPTSYGFVVLHGVEASACMR